MPLSDSVSFSQPLKKVLISRQSGTGRGVSEPSPDPEREEGEAVLAAAREASRQLQTAVSEAKAQGREEGRREQAEKMEPFMADLENRMRTVLTAIETEKAQLIRQINELLPELIVEGVGRVLYGLEPDAETIQKIVREILNGFDADGSQMRLALHPVDLENLIKVDGKIAESYPGLRLVGDDDLHRGECLLQGRFGVADARYSAKLSSLRKVLE